VTRLGTCIALAALVPLTAVGQAVRVRAVEPGTRRPLAGALVSLRADPTVALVQRLTDAAGRAVLAAPEAGRYYVRLDRIGYQGTMVGPVAVGARDTIAIDVVGVGLRVILPDLAVLSGSPPICRLDETTGAAVSMLWGEARKALVGTELTRLPLLEVTRYTRGYAPGSSIVEERSERFRTDSVTPFVAAAPARFRNAGYSEDHGASTTFFAPDATLLLSEEFLADHCFRVVQPDSGSTLIGLGFDPVPGGKKPDVAGALWLERSTGMLRHLEFEYRNLKSSFRTGHEGGRVDYLRLPNGGWLVARWRARVAWHERGGEVAIVGPDGRTPGGVVLAGVVFDSVARRPLEGAIVTVAGGAYVDTTEADGSYRLDLPTEGEFAVAVTHPRFRLFDWPASGTIRAVVRGQEARRDFGLPSAETVVARICGDRTVDPASEAVMIGQVTDSLGQPRPGEVAISWREPTTLRAGHRLSISEHGARLVVPSDFEGRFRVCGVPAGVELDIGPAGPGSSRPHRVTAGGGDLVVTEVRVVVSSPVRE
jgi:hypothetical protein